MPDRFSQLIGCVSELLYPIDDSERRIVHYWHDCHRELLRDPNRWVPAEQWRWHVRTLIGRYRDAFRVLKEGIDRGEFRGREEDFDIFVEIGRILRGIERAIGPAQDVERIDVTADPRILREVLRIVHQWEDSRRLQAYVYIFANEVLSLPTLEQERGRVYDAIERCLRRADPF